MKIIKIVSFILVPACLISVGAASAIKRNSQRRFSVNEISENEIEITGSTGKQDYYELSCPEASSFTLSADVLITESHGRYTLGLAAKNDSHLLDFGYRSDVDCFFSNAERYKTTTEATDLGMRNTVDAKPLGTFNLKLVKDEHLFYMLVDDNLIQSRDFNSDITTAWLFAKSCTVNFSNITFKSEIADVDKAIEDIEASAAPFCHGKMYATYTPFTFEDDVITVSKSSEKHPFEQSFVGFGKEMEEQEINIEFTTKNLSYDKNLVQSKNLYPKLGLVSYHDLGYADYICYGVGQDRIETRCFNGFNQWMNHQDLTGDETVLDIKSEINFRIQVINYTSSQVYQVYVNDVLQAMRTTTSYSEKMQFGIAAEYCSGEIHNLTINGVPFGNGGAK